MTKQSNAAAEATIPVPPEAQLMQIVGGCFQSQAVYVLPSDGRLLLVEMVVPAGNEAHFSKIQDLEMLVSPGGVERTPDEYRDLLGQAGFELRRIIPTKSPLSIVEAFKSEAVR